MAMLLKLHQANAWSMDVACCKIPLGLRGRPYSLVSPLQAVAISSQEETGSLKTDSTSNFLQKESNNALSLTLEELSQVLGGKGRARACWDCFRLGVDPLWFFSSNDAHDTEPLDSILLESLNDGDKGYSRAELQALITPRRQSQGMGKNSLALLEQTLGVPAAGTQQLDCMDSIAKVVQVHKSMDGTTKLLLQLVQDGLQVECVIIPWPHRKSSTLCISNQVGCAQACTFCSTGRMGELRSLTADEILVQVYWAAKVSRLLPDLFPVEAIVFMGMGEAARNVDPVVRSAENLADPQLFQLAPRRVTISTVAPTPEAFGQLGRAPAVLAWSVHASEDSVRKRLVPTTKHTMVELRNSLIQVLRSRPRKLRQVMLELALINDINDRTEDAEHLADFCKAFYEEVPGVKVVVNLIPWNDISATSGPAKDYQKPASEHVLNFQKVLTDQGILSYVRTTRGDDESAACGQLATKSSRKDVK